ncbi:MAG TPA: YncE family protein [Dermatophilaceae bacterium]|nr:YncE family protein [Dermatophilaceae bacterium]
MAHPPGLDIVIRNRRFAVMMVLALVVLGVSWVLRPERTGRSSPASLAAPGKEATGAAGGLTPGAGPGGQPGGTPTAGTVQPQSARLPSELTSLRLHARLTDAVAPASVALGAQGLVAVPTSASGHDVVLFRPDGSVAGRIPDAVELNRYRITGHKGVVRGSPAGAAVSTDGRHVYVTNYAMSGDGFRSPPTSACVPSDSVQPSFVYRLEVATSSVDQVIPVGAGPGAVALTPDGRYLLVANACSWDLSVVSTERASRVANVQLDGAASAVAISPDGRIGYAAVPKRNAVVAVDLATVVGGVAQAQNLATVEGAPSALAVSSDGRHLFVASGPGGSLGAGGSAGSLGSGSVAKLDGASGEVLSRVSTRTRASAIALSSDGTAVFVAGDGPPMVTKLGTTDLRVRAEIATPADPVGFAYDPSRNRLWVACRSGSVLVLDDTAPSRPATTTSGSNPRVTQTG